MKPSLRSTTNVSCAKNHYFEGDDNESDSDSDDTKKKKKTKTKKDEERTNKKEEEEEEYVDDKNKRIAELNESRKKRKAQLEANRSELRDDVGWRTALHDAARLGLIHVVEWLVQRGMNVNQQAAWHLRFNAKVYIYTR